jgi:hypothetical protein
MSQTKKKRTPVLHAKPHTQPHQHHAHSDEQMEGALGDL